MDISNVVALVKGLFHAHPVAVAATGSTVMTAILGSIGMWIAVRLYPKLAPIDKAIKFISKPLYALFSRVGIEENKISDPGLREKVKADTKNIGNRFDAVIEAAIDGRPNPEL